MSTTLILSLIIISLIAIVIYLTTTLLKSRNKWQAYEKKYSGIIEVDHEIQRRRTKFNEEDKTYKAQLLELSDKLGKLKVKYTKAAEIYDNLIHDSNLLKDDLAIAEFGIYESYYDFNTSERFKEEIKKIKKDRSILSKRNVRSLEEMVGL